VFSVVRVEEKYVDLWGVFYCLASKIVPFDGVLVCHGGEENDQALIFLSFFILF